MRLGEGTWNIYINDETLVWQNNTLWKVRYIKNKKLHSILKKNHSQKVMFSNFILWISSKCTNIESSYQWTLFGR